MGSATRALCNPLKSLSSYLSYLLLSSKFFDTQVPSIFTEELALPRHARCVLSRLRYNGRRLLLSSYLSEIGRIENPSCSACDLLFQDTFHVQTFAPLALWRLSISLRPLVQALGSCPAFRALWASAMSPSRGRGRVTTNIFYIVHSKICARLI